MGDTTLAEGHSQYGVTGGGGGVTDHGALTGLGDNDHPQYLLVADAGTAAEANTGTSVGNVPVLDANGKLATSVIPSYAIGDTFVVASEAAMLALSDAAAGDIAIRTDENKTYILTDDYATLADWKELLATTSWASVTGKPAFTTVTYAASIAPAAGVNKAFKCTLTGNVTLNKPTGASAGDIVSVDLIQDGTGSRTLTLGTGVSWSEEIPIEDGDSSPELSTAADTCDTLIMRLDPTGSTTNWVIIDYIKGEF